MPNRLKPKQKRYIYILALCLCNVIECEAQMLVIDFCRSKPLPQKLAQGGRRLCLLVIYHLMLGKMMCMYTAIDDACYSSATFLSPHPPVFIYLLFPGSERGFSKTWQRLWTSDWLAPRTGASGDSATWSLLLMWTPRR